MNRKLNLANVILSVLVGLTLLFSAVQPVSVSASTLSEQGEVPETPAPTITPEPPSAEIFNPAQEFLATPTPSPLPNPVFTEETALPVIETEADVRGDFPVYFELVLDEGRGWLYGSDSAGHKIDVIRISDLKLVKSFILPTTAAPKGIALSPDGGELAVANYGSGDIWSPVIGSIIFINLVTGKIIAKLVPDLDSSYNRPWDVIYGRPGVLYSTGNPGPSKTEYIHVIDTVNHVNLGRSSFKVVTGSSLAISGDKTKLYFFETHQTTETLKMVDVSTDTLPDPVASPSVDWLRGSKFILSADETKIFLDSGQVWNSNLQGPLGSTSWAGNMVLLPTHNAIAVVEDRSGTDLIRFVSTTNYYGIKSYTLPALGTIGPLVALSNGTKLFVSSSTGIVAVDLSAGLPGKAIAKPTGALPYYDLVADEARGVLYGSDPLGQKIDVIRISDLVIIRKVRLVNGASPVDIELSPDGSELAVALFGASSIVFLNPDNWQVVASLTPSAPMVNVKNMPWRIAYGRPGRLYSVGNPYSMGSDYIHVFDTSATPPTEVGISLYPNVVRMCPEMQVSSDGNKLFVHETCQSPQKITEYDITTDTPTRVESSPHASWLTGASFVLSDDNKIFIDSGQVWKSDLTGSAGATGQAGFLALIPSRNALAVSVDTTTTDKVAFYSTSDYYGIRAYTLPVQGVLGPMVATTTGDRLFVSTSSGVVAVDLSAGLPGAPIAKPKGALPYFDLVIDEARGVFYGSDPAGHKIDVVSMATQQVIANYYLVNGATPTGIALSPDGSELAVAEYGASSIVFLNPETGETIASLTPQIDSLNLPWDVIYGRPDRLYSTGAPASYGHDNIHVIDTTTHLEVGRSGFDWYPRSHPSLAISADGNVLYVDESYPSTHMIYTYDVSSDIPVKRPYINLGFTGQRAKILLLNDQSKIITSAGQIVDANLSGVLGTFTAIGPVAEIRSQNSFVSANGTSLNFYDLDTYEKIGFFPVTGVTSLGPMQANSDDSILYVSTDVGIKPIDLSDYPPVSPKPSPINLKSIASQDGWIRESGETTGMGGDYDHLDELTVGDYYTNEQYVSIVSFNTGFLMPRSAVVTKVTIKIKASGIEENTPFATLRYLTADIKSGSFGAVSLAPPDFETVASLRDIGRFARVPGTKWYQLVLKPAAIQFINRFGVTQFRLRFARDDDNDERSDYLNFYSGETKVIADRPTLIIEYVVP